jgi:hypothetical protein
VSTEVVLVCVEAVAVVAVDVVELGMLELVVLTAVVELVVLVVEITVVATLLVTVVVVDEVLLVCVVLTWAAVEPENTDVKLRNTMVTIMKILRFLSITTQARAVSFRMELRHVVII